MAGKIDRASLARAVVHYVRDERNFRDIHVSREGVSRHFGVSQTILSKVIHEELGTTFNDLVNKYRAHYARRLLLSPSNADSPLEEIAIRSGFSNRMTMHRAFLSVYGVTPGALRNQSRKS